MRRRGSRRLLLPVIVGLAIVTGITFGISYYAMRKMTFVGERELYGKKLSILAQEIRSELLKRSDISEVTFKTHDNLTLAGLLIKRQHPQANLIVCHGYKSNKELSYGLIDLYPSWNILLFDFRAHGQSEGLITTIGYHEANDVVAASNFLRDYTQKTYNKKMPLIILGLSMGGAALLRAAELEPGLCDALVVDSSYAKLGTTVFKAFSMKSSLPRYPFLLIAQEMFQYLANCDIHAMNPKDSVKTITKPILFIHSCDDNYISPKNAITLFSNSVNKQSKLWIGPHCRHAWLHSYYSELYKKKTTKFLQQVIPNLVA